MESATEKPAQEELSPPPRVAPQASKPGKRKPVPLDDRDRKEGVR